MIICFEFEEYMYKEEARKQVMEFLVGG